MKYQDCIERCIAHSLAEGREDHVELFRSYPQPNAEDWKRCLAEVKASGDDPSAFRCIGRYELLLASRGARTVLSAVARDFVKCVRRIGIDGNRVPDLLTLHTLLNDAHHAGGTRITVTPPPASYDEEPNLDMDPAIRRLLPGLVEQQLMYWSMRQKGHSHKEAILHVAKDFSDHAYMWLNHNNDPKGAEWAYAMAGRLRDSVSEPLV